MYAVDMSRKPRTKSPTDQPPMRPCAACGWDVLVATADKTGGYCFECQWLTTGEACSILRVERQVLYALADAGKLTRLKLTAHTHRWLRLDVDHIRSSRSPLIQSHRTVYMREEECASVGIAMRRDTPQYNRSIAA